MKLRTLIAAATLLFSGAVTLHSTGSVSAADETCTSSHTGCVRHLGCCGITMDYTFNTSDPNFDNNVWDVMVAYAPVSENIDRLRLNSAAYSRMCLYNDYNYVSADTWLVNPTRNTWYSTTDHHHLSLQYKTSPC